MAKVSLKRKVIPRNIVFGNQAFKKGILCFLLVLAGMLQVIYQLEVLVFGTPDAIFLFVGYAFQYKRVIIYLPHHVLIMNSANRHFAIVAFKFFPVLLIGKIQGNFDLNEMFFRVIAPVEPGFELHVGPMLQEIIHEPIADPVEQEHSKQ